MGFDFDTCLTGSRECFEKLESIEGHATIAPCLTSGLRHDIRALYMYILVTQVHALTYILCHACVFFKDKQIAFVQCLIREKEKKKEMVGK